jgi:hypothetical protein
VNKLHIINAITIVTLVLDWLYAYYDNVFKVSWNLHDVNFFKERGGHDEIHGEIIKLKAMIGWQNS